MWSARQSKFGRSRGERGSLWGTSALNLDQFKRFIATCVSVSHENLRLRNHMKKKQEGAVFVCGHCHHCRCVGLILRPV